MKAAIDIGTNTVLLLVAEFDDGRLNVIEEKQRAPRLGKGVDRNKNLSNDAMERVISVLLDYKKHLEEHYSDVEDVSVTATSAVRDANNRKDFLDQIKRDTGFSVEVLSGLEEAEYTYKGSLSVLAREWLAESNVILDIGGGSTEIAIGKGTTLSDRHSFDMGCVRFTERYLQSEPVTEREIQECRQAIEKELENHPFSIDEKSTRLIGVAGTVTSLAYIDLDLKKYEAQKINGFKITIEKLKNYIRKFSDIRTEDLIEKYPEVMKGRADIFLAGLLILEGFMGYYSYGNCIVSTGGVRHGAILESDN